MNLTAQVSVRTKKLGVLIRDARIAVGKTMKECAEVLGGTPGMIRAFEEGKKAPSLPELEVLAYFLKLPITHFWRKDAMSDDEIAAKALDLSALMGLRQRMIGLLLRQERMKTSLSYRALAEQSGISVRRLKAIELGERPIALPELEGLVGLLGGQIEDFFDRSGEIGLWMKQQNSVQDFLDLPEEIQQFVSKPVNRPYLDLALQLSDLSAEKLRAVAEGILDITL